MSNGSAVLKLSVPTLEPWFETSVSVLVEVINKIIEN